MLTISTLELKTKLDNGNKTILLDVREAWEYELCNIPDSINISMSNVDKMLSDLNADEEIVVICHHGMRSFQVASYLENNGFSQISNLEGGIDAWAHTVDPDMAQY